MLESTGTASVCSSRVLSMAGTGELQCIVIDKTALVRVLWLVLWKEGRREASPYPD